MAFRQNLRTRLQAIQSGISGINAELNVPPAITVASCPIFVNFLEQTTYRYLSGQGGLAQGDLLITMRLYLGAFNTVTHFEENIDTLLPLVEAEFFGNPTLALNNSPLVGVSDVRLQNNSGLLSQQYIVNAGDNDPHYAVVEFPLLVTIDLWNC